MDLDKIKKVIDLLNEHKLTEFTYEEHDKYKLTLKKGGDAPAFFASAPAQTGLPAAAVKPAQPCANEKLLESPLVGTYYSSASPDAPTYVKVGDQVKENTIVCIVEAMKVMNEVTAGFNGTVTEILVDNASPVEYGQPLMKIKVN